MSELPVGTSHRIEVSYQAPYFGGPRFCIPADFLTIENTTRNQGIKPISNTPFLKKVTNNLISHRIVLACRKPVTEGFVPLKRISPSLPKSCNVTTRAVH